MNRTESTLRYRRRAMTAIAVAALFLGPFCWGLSAAVSVNWVAPGTNATQASVEVAGLDSTDLENLVPLGNGAPRWNRFQLLVYAEQGSVLNDVDVPPMLGTYKVRGSVLRFEPKYPLQPGVTYRAVFRFRTPSGGSPSQAVIATHKVPPIQRTPTTVVHHVYPSADVLPENLLKFYVHFSAPMSGGKIYDHIHLQRENGQDVELPFLQIDEELWDPSMTRLTLFIDPGRIKRGVRPHEEIGPALEEGKNYALVIDRAWRDGTTTPLKESFRKSFRVGPPDREPIDPNQWKIQPPESGTLDALRVDFLEPIDSALALRMIQVVGADGERLDGTVKLDDDERLWSFTPAKSWNPGSHKLIVRTIIEDLAGNNVGKPFEVDVFEKVQRRITTESVAVPFEVP